jgi:hypothetical protein
MNNTQKTTARQKLVRILAGTGLVVLVLWISFVLALNQAQGWGATAQERAAVYPGDELLPNPAINWTNAATINAPVEKVWPWIAQMGESRGGYYSYTFIENAIVPGGRYHNADRIIHEYQNPQPGVVMIGDLLKVRAVKTESYLLADSSTAMGWNWLWVLSPLNGERTRLVVKIVLKPPAGTENPVATAAMGLGAFVMQRNMIDGIKLRAEGSSEPAYTEPLEISLWFVALMVGLAAALLFVLRPKGLFPLLLGLDAVVFLMVLTFLQPPILLRAGLDLLLLAGLVLVFRLDPA